MHQCWQCKSEMRVVDIECPGRYIASADKHAVETFIFHCDNCGRDFIYHDMHKQEGECSKGIDHAH